MSMCIADLSVVVEYATQLNGLLWSSNLITTLICGTVFLAEVPFVRMRVDAGVGSDLAPQPS